MKPTTESAKRRRTPFALVIAFASLLALPLIAQAAHWPNFGGDAGHSGNQPVNAATMAIQSLYRQTDSGSMRTSLVTSGGDAVTGQRVAYGKFIDVGGSSNDETRIRIRDLLTGAEIVPPTSAPDAEESRVIDDDTTGDGGGAGSDDRALGFGDNFVTPVSSSTHGGLGQLYVVHNDQNSAAQTPNECPNEDVASFNDIAIAQFDEATGAQKKDVSVGRAKSTVSVTVQGMIIEEECENPLEDSAPQITDQYVIESSPVLTPPDAGGRSLLFFVARYEGSLTTQTHRLFRVEIEGAGSPNAVVKSDTATFRDIPGLNTLVSPAIAYLREPENFVKPYVLVALSGGGSDVKAFKAEDIEPGEVDLEVPADIAGDPQAISVPTTEDGLLPGQPGSGDEKAPAIYVSYRDGDSTRVHRFVQAGSNEQLTDTVPAPPALDGVPAPGMALSQVVSGNAEQAGNVIVATSANLFALNRTTMAPAQRLRDAGESLLEAGLNGFSRNAPMTSGGFVFIQDDSGIPYAIDIADMERVDETEFTPESSHLEADYAFGQPSYSNGFLSFLNDRGLYTYQTGVVNEAPTASFTISPNPVGVNQPVTFDASASSDPETKPLKYEWDFDANGTFEVNRAADPRVTAAFPRAGSFSVTLRVTDAGGKTATTSRTLVVNPPPPNQNPAASFTATPSPAKVDQRVTFDGSASKDPDGTISKFEWDLDGNGTFETNSGTNPRVQRSYSRAAIYNVKLRVTDNAGGAGEVVRQLAVTGSGDGDRKRPRRLTAKVTPSRDALLPYDFRTTGRLVRPSGVSRSRGCTGRVTVVVKAGKRTISRRTTRLRRNCTYSSKVRFRDRTRIGTLNELRFTARFQGNRALRARQAKTRRVRIG